MTRIVTSIDRATTEREATKLAERLMRRAAELTTAAERRDHARLAKVVAHPEGIAFLARLLDRASRAREPRRLLGIVRPLLATRPRVLSAAEETLLDLWSALAPLAPRLAVPPFVLGLQRELRRYLVPGELDALERYVTRRRAQGVRVNLNFVGEAVLSRAAAEAWLVRCEAALAAPFIDAVSVKVSAICPRPHPLAIERLTGDVVESLARLYRAAGAGKLVSLDMEAFADLELTVAAFRAALDRDEFQGRTHGIALQAYLPDSAGVQEELTAWAQSRVATGGAPIRMRLVKGANLAAERLESRLRGLATPTFTAKRDTDAHFKHMLRFALEPEHAAAVRLGVASHNVFDVALALTLARERGTMTSLAIEMLHGMAEPLLRAVTEVAPEVLVYAPAASARELLTAVAYLLRRLDENAAPDHFLRHAFTMQVGDAEWTGEERRFLDSDGESASAPSSAPAGGNAPAPSSAASSAFRNEPEADWTRRSDRERASAALARTPDRPTDSARKSAAVASPDVEATVERLHADPRGWSSRSHGERRAILRKVAAELRSRHSDFVETLARETRKTVAESDPEICEAIDYAAYYADSLDALAADASLTLTPRGVVAVISPWNFPLAIPLGGVLASLIGGNRVALKPSPYAVQVATLGVEALWSAGVPRDALALAPADAEAGARLVEHPRLGALVFTGSTPTAKRLLAARPDLPVFAETGGKNAIIVTAAADRDRAIADNVRGAFSHGGQKCSAASLVVAEAEVFDDPAFRERLVDAAATLRLGDASDPATELAPLVTEPGPALASLLTRLPPGERWALEPRLVGERHLSPGIVWDVQEGSPSHRDELFGPVACVMRARDLDDAIRLVNASGFGLTSALESLDEREWRHWIDHIHAGNLYVNRPLVGAIVDRQPFGGWGLSSFGPGAKTGGPSYAAQLVRISGPASETTVYDASFARRTAHTQRIPGQLNLFRHRPVPHVVIRVEPGDDPRVVRLRQDAARSAGAEVTISSHEREPLAKLIERLGDVTRVVMCRDSAPRELLESAAHTWAWVCREPLTGTDRDLLPFLREQSISIDTQRHGWVAPGADDFLA